MGPSQVLNGWSRAIWLVVSRIGLGVAVGLLMAQLPMPWFGVVFGAFLLFVLGWCVYQLVWLRRQQRHVQEVLFILERGGTIGPHT